jgi:hypothetical protein
VSALRPALPLLLLAASCGSPPPPPPPAPAPAPTPAAPAPPPFAAGRWGEYRSERFGLRIPLPDGRSWRIDDHANSWLSATHASTGSALLVRAWHEEGRVNRHRCEEQARVWKKLPDPAGAEVIEQHTVNAPLVSGGAGAPKPGDFDTFVAIGVTPGKAGAPIGAFAIAFGGRGHRCFAWVFTTSATGAGAEQVVGERLATMVERSLGGSVLESGLTPRIVREPMP